MGLLRWWRERNIIKAKDLAEYIALLKQYGCTSVQAEFHRTDPRGPVFSAETSTTVGNIGIFEYWNRLVASTSVGKEVVFEEKYGEQAKCFGSTRGFGDAEARNAMSIRVLLTAEKTLEKIRESLPNIETRIEGFDQAKYRKLHLDANQLNLEPFAVAA